MKNSYDILMDLRDEAMKLPGEKIFVWQLYALFRAYPSVTILALARTVADKYSEVSKALVAWGNCPCTVHWDTLLGMTAMIILWDAEYGEPPSPVGQLGEG